MVLPHPPHNPKAPPSNAGWGRAVREMVEALITAFILAFLFRTFEAEAFIIPTGSMAPTLQGRHKDVACPKCGYEYRTSASQEVDENGNRKHCSVEAVTCPMCRYTVRVDPSEDNNRSEYPSYSGDRIVVNKFAYDVSDPQRWDVVVFKYPEDAKTNYIKRLVGGPNERLRIINGDIYTAPLGSDDFQIARKPPTKLRAMLQPVYDNNYVLPELIAAGVAPRWQPWNVPSEAPAWKPSDDGKSFAGEAQSPDAAWLRYQNIVPGYQTWERIVDGQHPSAVGPSLITDFYAYNDGDFSSGCPQMRDNPQWVGDLAVDCELDVRSERGAVTLELVKGGRQFRCRFDLATGQAALSLSGVPEFNPVAQTAVRGPGRYDISFANVDEQLVLWVDGELVEFSTPTTYAHVPNTAAVKTLPVPGADSATDLSPVGIAIEGGASVEVSDLAVWRDLYYIADPVPGVTMADRADRAERGRIIDLHDDQYFVLGDNSPQSKDSRYWGGVKYVDRRLLIGKALYIFWPHSFDRIEVGNVKIPFPYWPNFARMRFVH